MGRKKLVCGIGINDADYSVTLHDKETGKYIIWSCPYYSRWKGMLVRCYSSNHKNKQPSYKGCTVCEEWHLFSNFKSWMEKQDWEGKALDKDLIDPSNTVYHPDKCIFVDSYINSVFLDNKKGRGKYMLGVSYRNKTKDMINERSRPYLASVHMYGEITQINLGTFMSEKEAHRAWQKAKLDNLDKVKDIYKNDDAVVMIITQRYNKLKYDYDNFLETKSLHHY